MPKKDEENVTSHESAGDTEGTPDATVEAVESPLPRHPMRRQVRRLPDTTFEAVESLLSQWSSSEDLVNAHLREDFQELLVAHSLGADLSTATLHRYIPVEIYVPGDPDDIDILFLDLVMGLLEFSKGVDWQLHASGSVETSSLRLRLIFRKNQRLTLEDSQRESEIFEMAVFDRAENKSTAMREKETEAKTRLLTWQAALAQAKTFSIYLLMIGGLLAPFSGSRHIPPGTYIQVGTTRVEMKADGLSLEHVPSSSALLITHFPPKASAGSEKPETK